MTYGILLWPHPNSRYQQAIQSVAKAELDLLLCRLDLGYASECHESLGVQWLCFESSPLSNDMVAMISRLSSILLLARMEGSAFYPVSGRAGAYLGSDLPSVLKYKGKTNEQFTQLLLNIAVLSGKYDLGGQKPLTVCDPMCGRGTTLFAALNYGWNATGVDMDAADIHELNTFFKRYLTYHKLKHRVTTENFTIPGNRGVKATTYSLADTPERYKAGDVRTLRAVNADASQLAAFSKPATYHAIACDLPYGVQHAPGSDSARSKRLPTFEEMLRELLPVWIKVLKPGGAMALSFNTYTLPRDRLRAIMAEVGLEVKESGAYDRFTHWVEQAVNRDVAVGVKKDLSS